MTRRTGFLRLVSLAALLVACTPAHRDEALRLPPTDSTLTLPPRTPGGEWYSEWFTWTLTAMGEPWFIGAHVPGGMTIVRSVVMPPFSDATAIRLMIEGEHCTAVISRATLPTPIWTGPDSAGIYQGAGFHLGHRTAHDSLERPVADCRAAAAATDSALQWSAKAAPDSPGVDGTTWVLDLRDRDTLRIGGRWSPDSLNAAPIWRAGLAIRRAAGMTGPQ